MLDTSCIAEPLLQNRRLARGIEHANFDGASSPGLCRGDYYRIVLQQISGIVAFIFTQIDVIGNIGRHLINNTLILVFKPLLEIHEIYAVTILEG